MPSAHQTDDREPPAFTPEPGTLLVEDDALQYGFVQLPRQILLARNLTRDAKLLYAVLLHHAWQKERCFPGYGVLCHELQASENSVRKFMRELEAVGLLAQKRRGLGLTNVYRLLRLRTSKIEVLEPQKAQVLEPTKTEVHQVEAGEIETDHHQTSAVPMASTASQVDDDLLTLLTTRGVGKTQARRLVVAHGSLVREKIAEFDWRLKHQPRSVGKNAAGFLVASLQQPEEYPTPDEYRQAQTRSETRRRQDDEQARAAHERLMEEAQAHADDPMKRAEGMVTALEQARLTFRRQQPKSDEQLRRDVADMAERYRQEAQAFFAEHPDLLPLARQINPSEHTGRVASSTASPPL
jgi:hypothetical protein